MTHWGLLGCSWPQTLRSVIQCNRNDNDNDYYHSRERESLLLSLRPAPSGGSEALLSIDSIFASPDLPPLEASPEWLSHTGHILGQGACFVLVSPSPQCFTRNPLGSSEPLSIGRLLPISHLPALWCPAGGRKIELDVTAQFLWRGGCLREGSGCLRLK